MGSSLLKSLTGTSLKAATPTVQNSVLNDGLSGNIQTVNIMKRVAKEKAKAPTVRAFVTKILQAYKVPSHQYKDEALAIGEFIRDHVRYVRDPRDSELLIDPVMMIDQLENQGFTSGDCDDMALLIATLLLAVGHSPLFRCVRYQNTSGNYNHIYVVVYDRNYPGPNERIVLDAILKDRPIGSEIEHRSGDEIAI